MTEKEAILQKLHSIFPDNVIFKEEYVPSKVDVALSMRVWKQAKAEGHTSQQWLQENGFLWKTVGYIESDMKTNDLEIESKDAFSLADSIFRHYPLAGEYVLSEEKSNIVFQSAQGIVQKISTDGISITAQEKAILTFATIQISKRWDPSDETESNSFWDYIFLQYGIRLEDDDNAKQRIYLKFCNAVKTTLNTYNRFFANEGHRYYTSLLLHAISPRQSIENFFNILFGFYVENLDFQYVKNDTSYQIFVKNIQKRWRESEDASDNLKLKSDSILSGLKILFLQRPGYMACLCDEIVCKMDQLLRGQEIAACSYWDDLLNTWYVKKSSIERSKVQGERKARTTEFVATTEDRIYIQYAIQNNQVGIELPRIRLQEVGEGRPVLVLFQDQREVCRKTLSVMGNDLCLTTKSVFVPLADTNIDFGEELLLRGVIEYMGSHLYDSVQKLHRKYVTFDALGRERNVTNGTVFLLATNVHTVQFEGNAGVFEDGTHPGQFFRINLDEVLSVTIDGKEILAGAALKEQFRIYASQKAQAGISVLYKGRNHNIYSGPFCLFLHLPDGTQRIRYRVSLDNDHHSAEEYAQDMDDELCIPIKDTDSLPHVIKIVDVADDTIKAEYDYIILPGCSYKLDKSIYNETEQQIEGTLSVGGTETEISTIREQGANSITVVGPFNGIEFEIVIPTIQCTLMGQSAFLAPKWVWYEDISDGEFVYLKLPEGWNGTLNLGTRSVSSRSDGAYELCNDVRAINKPEKEEILWMNAKDSNGNYLQHLITTIVFEPKFLQPPLEYANGKLIWHGKENYIGKRSAEMVIEVRLPGGSKRYSVSCEDSVLEEKIDITPERYPYQVLLEKKSPFSRSTEEVYSGDLIVGHEKEFIFNRKEILLKAMHYWDFESDSIQIGPIKPLAGIITKMRYIGDTTASGEVIATPEYIAELCFEDLNGHRTVFNSNPNSTEYELINPVHVWIINKRLLILRSVSDDALYVDTKYNSILGRCADNIMTHQEQKGRLRIPDYFEYDVKEVK